MPDKLCYDLVIKEHNNKFVIYDLVSHRYFYKMITAHGHVWQSKPEDATQYELREVAQMALDRVNHIYSTRRPF